MKNAFNLIMILGGLAVLAGCSRDSGESTETAATSRVVPADLVLRGGKIATVDPALGSAEAIAVNGYQVTAVGSNDEISAYIGPETRVIELDGRFAMPGFIEGHGHFMSLGRSKQILDLQNINNWSEAVTMVAGAVDKSKPACPLACPSTTGLSGDTAFSESFLGTPSTASFGTLSHLS